REGGKSKKSKEPIQNGEYAPQTLKPCAPVKSPLVDRFIEVHRSLLRSFIYVLVIEEKLAKFAARELPPYQIVLMNVLVPMANGGLEFLETSLNRRSKPRSELFEFIESFADDASLFGIRRDILFLSCSLKSEDRRKLMREGLPDFITQPVCRICQLRSE